MDLSLITNSTKQLSRTITRNSPTILTALGVAGLLSTVILAIKATPKAVEIIEYEKNFRYDEHETDVRDTPLDPIDVIELTWKCYIPTILMGVTTASCIIGANHINLRRNAVLTSLFSIADTSLKEYQSKVVQTIGEKKAEKIRDEIAEEHMQKNPPHDNTIIMTGKGDHLCMDTYSGRWFRSDIEDIRAAVNSFNQLLLREGWLDINNFYERIDLPPIKMGDQIGWVAPASMLEVRYTTALSPKGEPALVMEYIVNPKTMSW